MDFGQHGLNGFLNVSGPDLAGLALVGAGFVFHDGNAVFAVAAQPGGDGAPGELARMAILVGEGHLADGLNALSLGVALGHVHGAEHAHFQINGGISHEVLFLLSCPPRRLGRRRMVWFMARRLERPSRGGGVPCRVVAGWPKQGRRGRSPQFGTGAVGGVLRSPEEARQSQS